MATVVVLCPLSSVSGSACLFDAWKVSSRGEFCCCCCCYYLYSQCNRIWVVHAWLDVSTQAWTSHARTGEWVTTR